MKSWCIVACFIYLSNLLNSDGFEINIYGNLVKMYSLEDDLILVSDVILREERYNKESDGIQELFNITGWVPPPPTFLSVSIPNLTAGVSYLEDDMSSAFLYVFRLLLSDLCLYQTNPSTTSTTFLPLIHSIECARKLYKEYRFLEWSKFWILC